MHCEPSWLVCTVLGRGVTSDVTLMTFLEERRKHIRRRRWRRRQAFVNEVKHGRKALFRTLYTTSPLFLYWCNWCVFSDIWFRHKALLIHIAFIELIVHLIYLNWIMIIPANLPIFLKVKNYLLTDVQLISYFCKILLKDIPEHFSIMSTALWGKSK